MDTSDASLLARMAQRDAQALEQFYSQHARAVYSLALFMLGEQARAAELTQEVFLLVWRSAPRRRPYGGLFRVDEHGFGVLQITAPGPLATYCAVGITEEPEGGSPGPTSPRLIGSML